MGKVDLNENLSRAALWRGISLPDGRQCLGNSPSRVSGSGHQNLYFAQKIDTWWLFSVGR